MLGGNLVKVSFFFREVYGFFVFVPFVVCLHGVLLLTVVFEVWLMCMVLARFICFGAFSVFGDLT